MPKTTEITEVKSIDNGNKLELKLNDGSIKNITSEVFSKQMPKIGDHIVEHWDGTIHIILKKDMDDLKSKGLHSQ